MKKNSFIFILSAIIGFVGFVIKTVSGFLMHSFNGLSMEEIIFHLKVPMKGTSSDMIKDYFKHAKKAWLIFLPIFSLFIFLISKFKKIRSSKILAHFSLFSALSLLFSGIKKLCSQLHFGTYAKLQMQKSDFIENTYVDPKDANLRFPKKKRNLIYIYLESMESTFTSKENGGAMDDDLILELSSLAKKNINFSQNSKIGGATASAGSYWTTGAMVTQSSGLPLLLPINSKKYKDGALLLKNTTTLTDILHKEGYAQEIMVGSDMTFGGRKLFYESHNMKNIYDYHTAVERKEIPKDYYVWWGFEDKKLIEYAKKEILELAKGDKPFHFSMLTVDTHHIGGYTCKDCKHERENQYENVLACSSHRIGEFIEWIQKQDFYKNTSIVLCGDHPTMDNTYIKEKYDGSCPRKVYNCYINPDLRAFSHIADENNSISMKNVNKIIKNREFNTFDFFPTTLAAMGVKIPSNHLGLGTNLFSGEKTLAEKFGYQKIDTELSKSSKYYKENLL